jgi:hypothetical protein
VRLFETLSTVTNSTDHRSNFCVPTHIPDHYPTTIMVPLFVRRLEIELTLIRRLGRFCMDRMGVRVSNSRKFPYFFNVETQAGNLLKACQTKKQIGFLAHRSISRVKVFMLGRLGLAICWSSTRIAGGLQAGKR